VASSLPARQRSRRWGASVLVVGLLLLGWGAWTGPVGAHGTPPATGRPTFTNVTGPAGLDSYVHAGYLGDGDAQTGNQPLFTEIIGPGACWFDADGDGWLDLYLVNGVFQTDPSKNALYDIRSRLFLNDRDGTFTDATTPSGTGLVGTHMGCSAADYDNDGDADLYVTGWGGNTLLQNQGNAVFLNVTAAAGVRDRDCGDFQCWGSSATWLDADRDGCLDLYVDHFGDFDIDNPPITNGPENAPGQKNRFFRNNCDGTFTDATDAAGLGVERKNSWGSIAADLDNDGDPDLWVANDGDTNDLYLNDGTGVFTRKAASVANDPRHGMGAASGDIDHDGRWDLLNTNYVNEHNGFYRASGDDYADMSADDPFQDSLPWSGWAVHFFDMNNDGHQDIMVVNGMTEDIGIIPLDEPLLLFENRGDATFQIARDDVGADFREEFAGRGGAWADYDNDGDVDVIVMEAGENPAHLFRADRVGGNFLDLDLVGSAPGVTRDAVGARVRVDAPGMAPQFFEKQLGTGFLSSSDPRIHVGIGSAEQASVTITWPDGSVQAHAGLRANAFYRATQGQASPEVVRELPILRLSGPGQAQRLDPVTLTAQAELPGGATLVSVEWVFGDGGTAQGEQVTHGFTDVGTFVVSATATDSLGRQRTQAILVHVTDTLQAQVLPQHAVFLPTNQPVVDVHVRFSDGAPVRDAEVRLRAEYATGIAPLDQAIGMMPRFVRDLVGYVVLEMDGRTDASGKVTFTLPYTFPRPSPLAPVEFNHPGLYTATATGGARGSVFAPAQGAYTVGVVPLQG
jgi:enediyne biosynthesis protein E4